MISPGVIDRSETAGKGAAYHGWMKKKGNYFGTEINGRWWKRYRASTFFARGNGELWLDEEGLHFLRKLTRAPLTITWAEGTGASLGKWHAGRWARGRPVLKVTFRRNDFDLSAGFYLSPDWAEMESFAADLTRRFS